VSASRPRNGFVLIATSIALVILLALAGLAVDIGRMYVVKSELQAFADAAALSAAASLPSGVANARQAPLELTKGPNAMKWDLGNQAITEFTVEFALGGTAPDPKTWEKQPKDEGDYHFVRVIATVPAPLIFLRPFQALHSDFMTVAVSGVAAQSPTGARLLQ